MIVHVVLACPSCRHAWHAATMDTTAWWARPVEALGDEVYCPKCDYPPPMQMTTRRERPPERPRPHPLLLVPLFFFVVVVLFLNALLWGARDDS